MPHLLQTGYVLFIITSFLAGVESLCFDSKLVVVVVVIGLRPGFHHTTNVTTTTQKQSDYKVEQSSFTLIALF